MKQFAAIFAVAGFIAWTLFFGGAISEFDRDIAATLIVLAM